MSRVWAAVWRAYDTPAVFNALPKRVTDPLSPWLFGKMVGAKPVLAPEPEMNWVELTPLVGTLVEGNTLVNVHNPKDCTPPCVIHSPTDHHMRGWQLLWRNDRGIFERICPHGVGHPDPDQFAYWERQGREWETVHGCDGCCKSPDDSPYFEGDVRIDADPDTAPAAGD